jgi:hypothetical protein
LVLVVLVQLQLLLVKELIHLLTLLYPRVAVMVGQELLEVALVQAVRVVAVLMSQAVKQAVLEIHLQHLRHKVTMAVTVLMAADLWHLLVVAVVLVPLVQMQQHQTQVTVAQEVLHITPSTYLLGSLQLIQVKAI